MLSYAILCGFIAFVYLKKLNKATTNPKLFLCKTFHARFYPCFHSFLYPLFYCCIDINKDFGLISNNKFGLLSIYWRDYLDSSDLPLPQKLQSQLKMLGLTTEYDRVELLTTPRFLGMAFNPLSIWCIYSRDNLTAVLLEVNNTFKEKHLYLCHSDNRTKPSKEGYSHTFELHRAFHVSPFNNRTGKYQVYFEKSLDQMDLLLNISDYQDGGDRRQGKIHLTARVYGNSYDLDFTSVLHLCVFYPLNVFLTLPRIFWEATKLTYQKRMKVNQRPTPYRDSGSGKTVISKPPSTLQLYGMEIFFNTLNAIMVERLGSTARFEFILPDLRKRFIPSVLGGDEPLVTINIMNWNAFTWFILENHRMTFGIFLAFSKGDMTADSHSINALVSLLTKKPIPPDRLLPTKLHYPNQILNPKSQYSLLASPLPLWISQKQIHLESFLFKNSAEFVPGGDSWNLVSRCLEYLRDSNEIEYSSEWNGIDELSDSVGGLAREQMRAYHFLNSM